MAYKEFSVRILKHFKNEKGATLIYILAAFMVVSFIGTVLIKSSNHDVKASADYSAMKSAEEAAKSGLQATEIFFNAKSDSTVKILNKYIAAPQVYPLLGSSADLQSINESMSYFTEIISFTYDTTNNTNFVATIKSYGFGPKGSKKTVISLVNLDGLDWVTITSAEEVTMAAFRLAGNSDFESNCNIEVTGFARLSGKLTGYSIVATFNDEFYQDDGSYVSTFDGGTWTFKGKAYFGGHLEFTTTITFEDSVGFLGSINGKSYPPNIGGPVYHGGRTSTASWPYASVYMDWPKSNSWNMNGHDIHSERGKYIILGKDNNYLDAICTNKGNVYQYDGTLDINSALNFNDLPGDISLNDSILDNVTHYTTSGTADAAKINSLYDEAAANNDTLCGGFAVIRGSGLTPAQALISDNFGVIADRVKAIIIWEGSNALSNFPECSGKTNIILLCRITNKTTIFGGFDYFRGVVYVEGAGFQFQPESPSVIDGATYYSPGAQHYNNSGGGVHYKHNPEVLQEVSCLNLFNDGSTTVVITTKDLEVTAPITCNRLAIQL